MADPAIRAALEAAEQASAEAWARSPEDVRGHHVAIIAAFLRALPERFPMPGQHNPACQVWGHLRGEMKRLAAAVEEAARDA